MMETRNCFSSYVDDARILRERLRPYFHIALSKIKLMRKCPPAKELDLNRRRWTLERSWAVKLLLNEEREPW